MRMMVAACLACFVLQQPQTPVFRGSTDVVVLTVQATSRDGAPVEGLTAADFTLKVDGKPRAIASVEFQRIDDARAANFAEAGNSALSMGPGVTAQSFVLIVADPFMMRPESSRPLFDQAAEFVAKLPRAHAVGLWFLPAQRPQFPFSENRQPMVAALRRQLGGLGTNSAPTLADSIAAMPGLQAAIDTLRSVNGRRTLVFLSDSLILGDSTDALNRSMMDTLRRGADGGVVIHTITTAPPAFRDAGRRTSAAPPNAVRGNLELLSDLTGGLFLERGSNASIVLPQIERLLSAQYVLAFNVEKADNDGKTHKIDVKVNLKDVAVRFRKEFVR